MSEHLIGLLLGAAQRVHEQGEGGAREHPGGAGTAGPKGRPSSAMPGASADAAATRARASSPPAISCGRSCGAPS